MIRHNLTFRIIGVILLACFFQAATIPSLSLAQDTGCSYDRAKPSLENARVNFKSLDYNCAEQEILDYLKLETIPIEQRADAHVLLAAVYYAKSKNSNEKRSLVIEQFKKAFEAYRQWRGELDISSTEFIGMMNEAQRLVDEESKAALTPPQPPVIEKPAVKEETPSGEKKKPWYKKWWAIGLGVGVVAGVAFAVAGGGGDEEPPPPVSDTLPSFPDTPGGK